MAKTLANYDPLVQIPSGMTPAGADFPIVESHDILVGENDKRLDAKLDDIDSAIGNVGQTPIATQLSSKVNTGDIVTSVAATGSTSNNKIPSETAVRAAIEAKTINVDSTVTEGSANAVSGGAVHTQLATKQDALTFDTTPTASSSNPVTSGGVKAALDNKQNTLTYETTPIVGSVNPVTSTGIRNAIDTAAAQNLGAMQAQYAEFVADADAVLDRASSLSNGMVACSNISAETTVGDTRILLYTGTTNANYTNGHWYYNSAPSNAAPSWTDGGAVGSAPTIDSTLAIDGAAANSKAVGDAIENIVTISNTQPGSNSGNKVWIKETTSEEVQVPTYAEHIAKANKADIATNNESDNGSGTISASKAYAIGDHFYINNTNTSSENYGVSTLYKATAAIASGDAIVVGTNCEASKVADEITSLSNDLDTYSAEIYKSAIINDWSEFGTNTYPLGWAKGYYGVSTGDSSTSNSLASHYIRSVKPDNLVGGKYKPNESIASFVASVPSPFAIAVFEYAEDGAFVVRHGNMKSTDSDATHTISVQHTAGHAYNFCVGYFDDYADYVADNEFLSTISVTEYTSKILNIEIRIADVEEIAAGMQNNLNGALDSLNNLNTLKLADKLYEITSFNNWASLGTVTNPSGWVKGYVAASAGNSAAGGGIAPYYIRSLFSGDSRNGGAYMPDDSVVYFTASAPDTYAIAVFEYDETDTYLLRHGVQDSRSDNATNNVTVQHTSGHTYIFSVGYFVNGDSENYISDSTFLSNIIITETRCKLGGVDALLTQTQSDIESTKNTLNTTKEFNWSHLGTINYPLGWRIGYYRSSDGSINQTSTSALCTPGSMYIPPVGVKEFTIKAPDGYSVCVSEYSFSEGYQRSIGGIGSTTQTIYPQITIEPNENCYYKFAIGYLNNNADQYLNSEFIDQILFTETYFAGEKNKDTKHLNILLFGNSYFADSWAYVPFILKKYGITCNIHFYYRGSGSVDRLVAEWEDSTTSGLDDFGKSHVRRYAHIDTRYQKAWENGSSTIIFSPKQVLEKVNNNPNFNCWDIIVMSAGSRSQSFTVAPGNGDPRQGAEPYIRQAINLINASYNKPYHLGWFGAYTSIDGYEGNASKGYPAISGTSMDNRIGVLKSTEAIMSAEPFDIIFPAGTAVFNARTNASLASTSLSATGNLWCADKVHLHAGIPNYIANCAVVQSIFKKFYPQLSIIGDDTRITDTLISSYSCPFITSWCGNVMDNTELLYELGQKAAFMAVEHPYVITPIYLPTDTTQLEWLDSHSDKYWADALIDTSNIN